MKYQKNQEVEPNSQHEFSSLKESITNLESLEQYTIPKFRKLLRLDWVGMCHSKESMQLK